MLRLLRARQRKSPLLRKTRFKLYCVESNSSPPSIAVCFFFCGTLTVTTPDTLPSRSNAVKWIWYTRPFPLSGSLSANEHRPVAVDNGVNLGIAVALTVGRLVLRDTIDDDHRIIVGVTYAVDD